MANLLKDLKVKGTVAEKVKAYNDANREVAILCNHKRTVAAGHAGQMEKMEGKVCRQLVNLEAAADVEQIDGMRYQQWRLKQMILDLDPKEKKSKKRPSDYFELPEHITEDWVLEHQAALVEEQREKIKKKFEKDNEKRLVDGEKKMSGKELDERLAVADELEKKFKKENKTKKVEAEGRSPTVEKLEESVKKLDERIEIARIQQADKEGNKEVALGTSKIVSRIPVQIRTAADVCRTISILVLRLSSPRGLTFRSSASSPRHCARSSTGLSSPCQRIGNSSCLPCVAGSNQQSFARD